MEEVLNFRTVKGIIRRRWRTFAITFSAIFLAGMITAVSLPPVYRSEATILIEGQQIPKDYVKSTITGYVEERIAVIKQQILTRKKLSQIIDEFNLYPDLRARKTRGQIVAIMRNAIKIGRVSANVQNQRTGRPQLATIAFNLSYDGNNPTAVYKVASKLTSLFLEEDLKTREKLSSTTTDFLGEELKNLEKKIQQQESAISQFKKAHIGELPENRNSNLQAVDRYERDLDRINSSIRDLREKKVFLEGQIASIDPLRPVITKEGKISQNPTERLKALRLQLTTLRSTLSDKHPDIKKLKREIKELETQVGKADDSVEKIQRLNELKGELAAVKGEKGPKHPDVIKLSKEIALLSKEVDNLKTTRSALEISRQNPDNPAYISLKTQLAANGIMTRSLLKEKAELKANLEKYYKKLADAPAVEKAYNELQRDYQVLKRKYGELSSKLMTAKISQGMEQSQRGEKFTITDPPQLPRRPYKPNRIVIALIGLVLAIGAGVGLALFKETIDFSVKSSSELKNITGLPVFSVISVVESDRERRARRIKRMLWVSAAVCAVVLALIIVNKMVMPLDVLWIKLQHRLVI